MHVAKRRPREWGKKRLINDARALLGTFLCLDNCSLLLFTVRCFWLIGFASYQFRMERLNADGRRRKTTSEFIHPDMIGACWEMLWMMSKFSARCRVSDWMWTLIALSLHVQSGCNYCRKLSMPLLVSRRHEHINFGTKQSLHCIMINLHEPSTAPPCPPSRFHQHFINSACCFIETLKKKLFPTKFDSATQKKLVVHRPRVDATKWRRFARPFSVMEL